jgi:ATP-dependent helicase HrpB
MTAGYPIEDVLPALKEKLAAHRRVVLQAPPGAGKSTVLPPALLDEPWLHQKKIIMLEPRRLAARSIAARIADLLGETVGATVGYRIRFETAVSHQTRLEVVTEGILARMLQHDSALEGYGLIIFDEFHERSLHTDLALALCLQMQELLRDDVRLLVMSATIDGPVIAGRLQTPLIVSEGRRHPVDVRYRGEEAERPLPQRVAMAVRKAWRETEGDILVFLPGAAEINRTRALLEEAGYPSVHTLHGDAPFGRQQQALQPHPGGLRKIVLSTSIAETSLTIEGVRVVIDAGLARVPRFDPRSGLTRLETVPVTRDAADQRAGRAGRLGPGVCYRLWPEARHQHLQPERKPEILEADLAPMLLTLLSWGVRDVNELFWMTAPPPGAVQQALSVLTMLQALNNGGLTPHGKKMAALPDHPRLTHLLLQAMASGRPELPALAADLVALLGERDPLGRESGADISLRIVALRRWREGTGPAPPGPWQRIDRAAAQWRKIFKMETDNAATDGAAVGLLISWAFPDRVAGQAEPFSARYKLVNGRMARLPDNDSLNRYRWLAIAEADLGATEGKIFMAAPLDESEMEARSAVRHELRWDEAAARMVAQEVRTVGALVVARRPQPIGNPLDVVPVWCELLRARTLALLAWPDEVHALRARLLSLRLWRPEEPWPDVSDAALLNTLEDWLAPFLPGVASLAEINKLDWPEIFLSSLTWPQRQALDALAPARLPVPSGSLIRVSYFADGRPPVMEVRLQELFGLAETPAVNGGRTRVLLHLLSPGYKPVQVTQDLKSFWNTTYYDVRKELRARYPKHAWPDDPWTAPAVRGVRRKS